MNKLTFGAVLEVLRFIGNPRDFFVIPCICKSWANVLDTNDGELWLWIAAEFNVIMHSPHQKRSLRSTSNHKSVFMKAFVKGNKVLKEKHEYLLLQARSFFRDLARDSPKRLLSLIEGIFPAKTTGFDVNWTSSVVELNTLASICARGASRPKCLKLLLETYKADINLGDVGGFNPLILSAYHGNLACTIYCVKRGANILSMGRERSGTRLIAEHWASIRGHWDVFRYLRSTRLKLQKKIFLSSQNKSSHGKRLLEKLPGEDDFDGSGMSPSCGSNQDDTCSTLSKIIVPLNANDMTEQTPSGQSSCDCTTLSSAQQSASSSLLSFFDLEMDPTDAPISTILSPHSNQHLLTDQMPVTYCVCARGHIGSMIECDGPDCLIGWFHYTCVGLDDDLPDESQWLCPSCIGGIELNGTFPEPRPSHYSSFLNSQMPPLTINTYTQTPVDRSLDNRRHGPSVRTRKSNKKIKICGLETISVALNHADNTTVPV